MFILLGIVAGLLAAVPVGPVNVFVISQALKRDFLHGLMAGLTAVALDMSFAFVALAGFFQIKVALPPHFISYLKAAAAVIILLLARKLIRDSKTFEIPQGRDKIPAPTPKPIHDLRPGEVGGIEPPEAVGRRRDEPDEPGRERHGLQGEEAEESGGQRAEGLQRGREVPVERRLLVEEDVGRGHRGHGQLDDEDRPFLDRGGREGAPQEEGQEPVFEDGPGHGFASGREAAGGVRGPAPPFSEDSYSYW